MRRITALLFAAVLLALQSCAPGTGGPPALSPAVVAAGAQAHANAGELSLGRSLFVRRCLQCHALPAVTERSADEWRKAVRQMAPRSGLKASEEAAVLAYLMAARATL